MTLVEDARPAARRLLEASSGATVRLVAHPSGDGVAAAAVLSTALARAGRAFHVRFARPEEARPDPEVEGGEAHVLLGLGAPPAAHGPSLTGSMFLIDADPRPWPREAKGLVLVNPVHLGEAAAAASASTSALALALALDEANRDLTPLALVGAIAAGRHRPAFSGWTEAMRADALRRGGLAEAPRPHFDDEALVDLLAFPPAALRRLGGGYPKAEAFVRDHRLPPEATVHELDEATRQRLASALALRLLEAGEPAADLARLVSVQTIQPATGLALARIASWLDAAAREGEGGLALGYALGDADAREELDALESRVRRRRRESLRALEAGPSRGRDGVDAATVAHAADVAPLATLLAERWPLEGRLLVVCAGLGHETRASVRRAPGAAGPDVGALVAHSAAQAGGQGGGRPESAGARVPRARLDAFLDGLVPQTKVEVP
jgi:DHH family putative phosphoesterase